MPKISAPCHVDNPSDRFVMRVDVCNIIRRFCSCLCWNQSLRAKYSKQDRDKTCLRQNSCYLKGLICFWNRILLLNMHHKRDCSIQAWRKKTNLSSRTRHRILEEPNTWDYFSFADRDKTSSRRRWRSNALYRRTSFKVCTELLLKFQAFWCLTPYESANNYWRFEMY
jgi:hypothetical protein